MDEKKEKEIGYCDAEGGKLCCGMCKAGFILLPLEEEVFCVKYEEITLPHMRRANPYPED